MKNGGIEAVSLLGTKKSIQQGVDSGGGYIAHNQSDNIYDAAQKRKHVDLSGVSAFCAQQTQLS